MTQLFFFGSDQYSAVVLQSLRQNWNTAKLQNLTIITDQKKDPNPVETLAREHSLPVTYYSSLITNYSILTTQPDTVGLSASFPHLFPPELISAFQGNLYNLHPSLLPQYRNVAPVPYAIALGDQVTGITLFRIAPTIDNGEIIAQVEEPIYRPTDLSAEALAKADTTPALLTRLFSKGVDLFLSSLHNNFAPTAKLPNCAAAKLIFTRKLTRQSGYIEWGVVKKLLQGQALKVDDTQNELLRLRLGRTQGSAPTNILNDLIRALTGYEKVWTIAPTRKGDLPISLALDPHCKTAKLDNCIHFLIPGKPRPIPYSDFTKYYL